MAMSIISKILECVWSKGFIVSQASANAVPLTNAIHLRAGTWILIGKTPFYSNWDTLCALNFGGTGFDIGTASLIGQGFIVRQSYGLVFCPIRITEPKDVALVTGGSQSVSWDSSYLDRGGIFAVRVGN